MKSFATLAALLTVLPVVLADGQLQINSLQSVVVCEPILITWTGGTSPYYLSLIPANEPGAPAIKQFDPLTGTSFTWAVDLAAGTAFTSELKDASGQAVYSGAQIVEAGTDESCMNTGVTDTVSGTSVSATSTDATSATSPAAAAATKLIDPASSSSSIHSSTTTGTTAVHVASSGSATATASSATATSTENGASRDTSFGAMGIAGVLGLIGAALF